VQKISVILLAAGFSRRTDKDNKLLLPIDGKPMLQYAVDLLAVLTDPATSTASLVDKILVTTINIVSHVKIPDGIKVILNREPEKGQSESIKVGLKIAKGNTFFFMVADQPLLTLDDIKPLLSSAINKRDKIIYPLVNERPSAPTIFPERFKSELLALTGDLGGREIRNRNPQSCFAITAKNPDNFTEINNMVDYYNLFSKGNSIL